MTSGPAPKSEGRLRPRGITILCLLLAYLSLAGFANTGLLLVVEDVPLPRWLAVFALVYGITTIMASIRLWRMQPAGLFWLRGWFVVLILMNLGFAAIPMIRDNALGGTPGIAVFTIGLCWFLWLLDLYVRRKLAAVNDSETL